MENKDSDHEMMMDQVAHEAMEAIEKKDKDQFKECLHVLISDLLMKMQPQEGE